MPVLAPYQIILLGSTRPVLRESLRAALHEQLTPFRLDESDQIRFLDAEESSDYLRTGPAVCVFIGGHNPDPVDAAAATELADQAVLVLPLVESFDGYKSQTPAALHPINGDVLTEDDGSLQRAASKVLEGLGLLRRSRRLFISYRRNVATVAALQVYEHLDARGFDVFLDTRSIKTGDPFQDELLHRLSDSDVVVILDTDNFLESEWTRSELTEAQAMSLGIVQVQWPGVSRTSYDGLCDLFELAPQDFCSEERLKPQTLENISRLVETSRARSVAARHTSLATSFDEMAERAGITSTVQPHRFMQLHLNTPTFVVPNVGVPHALTYHETDTLLRAVLSARESNTPSDLVLLYDAARVRPHWRDHLVWLDSHLPVKTVAINEAKEWLENLQTSDAQ